MCVYVSHSAAVISFYSFMCNINSNKDGARKTFTTKYYPHILE